MTLQSGGAINLDWRKMFRLRCYELVTNCFASPIAKRPSAGLRRNSKSRTTEFEIPARETIARATLDAVIAS